MSTSAQRSCTSVRSCGAAAVTFFILATCLRMSGDGNDAGAVVLLVLLIAGLVTAWISQARRTAAQEAQLREIHLAQSMEISRYHAMNSREFEQAIAYLCERDGCYDVRVTGGAGDLGADVIATTPDGRRIVIQCKRYSLTHKVGSQDLQRFGGTCFVVHQAQVAALVTTTQFTKPAATYARQSGIRCYDQNTLAAWASRTGPAPWA
ncbi:restriction endonuclease [Streptomyces sp. NPDC051173]|uniref:restriction endonuclease n=1 Tax=Streptomyces sp. NPDC051173 TaxID=3155164 RepID=UPI00344DC291